VGSVYEPRETARLIDLVLACLALFIVAPFVEDSTLWLKLGGWWSIGPVGTSSSLMANLRCKTRDGSLSLVLDLAVSRLPLKLLVLRLLPRVMQVHAVGFQTTRVPCCLVEPMLWTSVSHARDNLFAICCRSGISADVGA
jgi:hypothetical protein